MSGEKIRVEIEVGEKDTMWSRKTLPIFQFIEELRRLPADVFNIPAPMKLDRPNGRVQLSVGPRIDGKFFPKPLAELRNETKGKPHIVGMAGEEGLLTSS